VRLAVADEKEKPPRPVGLKAIDEARSDRGRSRANRITGPVALVVGGVVLLVLTSSYFISTGSLAQKKEDLLVKQRTLVKSVGAEWFPLRDKIEKVTLDAASGEYKGDQVLPEAQTWDFRSLPGIYLRSRVSDAKDVESLRKQARESGRDAFSSCFLRENNPTIAAQAKGEDAGAGWEDQPWNLRQAYTSTRVLEDGWAQEVKDAKEELFVRAFELQYEKSEKEEIPLAINIVKRAQFFLLVLDEDVPEAKELATDGGKVTWAEVQQVPHPTRVHVFNLKTDKEVVRVRRSAEGEFRFAGERAVADPNVRAAMKRQVNNCALAQVVWASIKPSTPSP
jgi:hypothetical protein